MNCSACSDERHIDLKQVLDLVDLSSICHEQDYMIVSFDDGVMMSNNHLVTTHQGNDIDATR